MKINRISWTNYRNLADDELIADGADMLITGRNGTGKTSIAGIVAFVLFGENADKSKCYDDGLLPTDDGLIHGAEVEFDNGTTLRREYFWKGKGNTNKLFVDGVPVSKTDFEFTVRDMTKGADEILLNPFAFPALKKDEQRALLTKIFVKGSDEKLLNTDEFADVKNFLRGLTAAKFISDNARTVKKLRKTSEEFTARITELQTQLDGKTNDPEKVKQLEMELAMLTDERGKILSTPDTPASAITEQIATLREERAKIRAAAQNDFGYELTQAQRHLDNLNRKLPGATTKQKKLRENFLSVKASKPGTCPECATDQLKTLNEDFLSLKASKPGKCPTCGQAIPVEQFTAKRDARIEKIIEQFTAKRDAQLAEIVAEGKKATKDVDDLTADLNETAARIEELNAKKQAQATENATRSERVAEIERRIAELSAEQSQLQADAELKRREQFDKIDRQITDVRDQLLTFRAAQELRDRVDQLRDQQRKSNEDLATVEYQIDRAKIFQQRKIELVEGAINSKFEHVQFKLFDVLIGTGEVKPTCEPMLHGVPYSSLSKGERLKAALDIFNTLQKFYGVELPLIIDDAESYTMNSLLDLPNQKFFFRVEECDLTIKIDRSVAA